MLKQISRFIQKKPWRVVKGDLVEVITGRDKRKQGHILSVLRNSNQVIVSGVNIKTKHVAASMENPFGKIEQKEFPIDVSNVALIDPETQTPCRVKFGYLEDGSRVRVSVKSGALVPKPERENHSYAARNQGKIDGVKDTPYDVAFEQTYFGEDYEAIEKEFQDYIQERERQASWLVFRE